MGKEITVLVADTANQTSLKAYSSKVSGWTAPYLHTKLYPLNVMAVCIIIITTHINEDTNGLLFSRWRQFNDTFLQTKTEKRIYCEQQL